MKIYLAGSIFYYGDVLRNTEWATKIRAALPNIDLYSPIENTEINGAEGKKKNAGSIKIVDADNERLLSSDVLIACIDGDTPPIGTSAEIGFMSALIENGAHKLIIGICTDNRQCFLTHSAEKDAAGAAELGEQQYSYQNLYLTGLIKKYGVLVSNIDDAIAALRKWVADHMPIDYSTYPVYSTYLDETFWNPDIEYTTSGELRYVPPSGEGYTDSAVDIVAPDYTKGK